MPERSIEQEWQAGSARGGYYQLTLHVGPDANCFWA